MPHTCRTIFFGHTFSCHTFFCHTFFYHTFSCRIGFGPLFFGRIRAQRM